MASNSVVLVRVCCIIGLGTEDHTNKKAEQLKDVIQDLYQIMIQVNSFDQTSRPSSEVLQNNIKQLDRALQKIHTTATHPATYLPSIPPELIQYVDNGRNPDIYTRELVEAARKSNQLMRGKTEAFASMRDVLAEAMRSAMPELTEDVNKAVEATGGVVERKSSS
jgi:mediator of RNA polymerase II transcription subunit 10